MKENKRKKFLIIGMGDFGRAVLAEFKLIAKDEGSDKWYENLYFYDQDKEFLKTILLENGIDEEDLPKHQITDKNKVTKEEFGHGTSSHAIMCIGKSLYDIIEWTRRLSLAEIGKITIRLQKDLPNGQKIIEKIPETIGKNNVRKTKIEFVYPEKEIAKLEAIEIVSDQIDDFLPMDQISDPKNDRLVRQFLSKKQLMNSKGIFKFRIDANKEDNSFYGKRKALISFLEKQGKNKIVPVLICTRDKENVYVAFSETESYDFNTLEPEDIIYFYGTIKDSLLLDRKVNHARKKTIIVAGLGDYGYHLCENLLLLDYYKELFAIDKDQSKVDRVADLGISICRTKNCTSFDDLEEIGFNKGRSFKFIKHDEAGEEVSERQKDKLERAKRKITKRHAIVSLGSGQGAKDRALEAYLNFTRFNFEDITVRLDESDGNIYAFMNDHNGIAPTSEDDSRMPNNSYLRSHRIMNVVAEAAKKLSPRVQSDLILDWRQSPEIANENEIHGIATIDISKVFNGIKRENVSRINNITTDTDEFDKSPLNLLMQQVQDELNVSLHGLAFNVSQNSCAYVVYGRFKDIVRFSNYLFFENSSVNERYKFQKKRVGFKTIDVQKLQKIHNRKAEEITEKDLQFETCAGKSEIDKDNVLNWLVTDGYLKKSPDGEYSWSEGQWETQRTKPKKTVKNVLDKIKIPAPTKKAASKKKEKTVKKTK